MSEPRDTALTGSDSAPDSGGVRTGGRGFIEVRDQAVFIGTLSNAITIDELQDWIEQAERFLAFSPILDPTAFMRGNDELQKQVRYMRALLAFRREVVALTGGPPG